MVSARAGVARRARGRDAHLASRGGCAGGRAGQQQMRTAAAERGGAGGDAQLAGGIVVGACGAHRPDDSEGLPHGRLPEASRRDKVFGRRGGAASGPAHQPGCPIESRGLVGEANERRVGRGPSQHGTAMGVPLRGAARRLCLGVGGRADIPLVELAERRGGGAVLPRGVAGGAGRTSGVPWTLPSEGRQWRRSAVSARGARR
mmetsp:Transcript_76130/g.221048  ORF Transcript_76130/g.221048 Transcript_76130/m.221048 type:complete len:203 (+) Transcript_76130:255-863(+)